MNAGKLERYKNLGGDSPILAYGITDTSITIQYSDGGIYLYTYANPGKREVETMKKLAIRGDGLSTYINTNVRKSYERKIA